MAADCWWGMGFAMTSVGPKVLTTFATGGAGRGGVVLVLVGAGLTSGGGGVDNVLPDGAAGLGGEDPGRVTVALDLEPLSKQSVFTVA